MTAAIAPSTFFSPNPAPCEHSTLLNLLIVDEDRFVREACREAAAALGYGTSTAQSAEQALWLIDSQMIDVVLLDLNVPDALREIKHRRPDIEVIVVSGRATVDSAVQAMKNGAYDYITKPFGLHELKLLLERVATHLKLKVESRRLSERIKSDRGFGRIIGRAPEMDKLYRMIGKAAQSAYPVLILGESGTGKEMVAQSVLIFGQRPGPPSGRRPRGKPAVPEQASLFG